jgi:hypothetical protein
MMHYIKTHPRLSIALFAGILSILAWIIFYRLGLTTDYNDAMSHLNIARLVVDNMQPGMSQLGSVWLPMSHILSLPLVWNDFLWHSGLAGSLISMASFVLSAIGIYRIIVHLIDSQKSAAVGTAAFCLSLNMLYLQTTPLTEPLYLAAFVYTVLFLVEYLKHHSSKALIALGAVSAIGILTRYDAWFVAVIVGVIIVTNELLIKKQTAQTVVGYAMLYAFPIGFAVTLWLGWNLLIFGDPLYSFVGPYSARAQQSLIESSSGLITKYNIGVSLWAYLLSILQNVGIIVSILGTLGWILYLSFARNIKANVRIFSFIGMISIVIFNVLALFLGFSILNLPELGWNPSGTLAGQLFNVRYGVLALPFAAVGVGLLAAQLQFKKYTAALYSLIILALLTQSVITYFSGIITVEDGKIGSSAFVNDDIARAIKASVKPGETVIMSTSSYNAVAFKSGLHLRSFIHEGVSKSWNGAISQPEKYSKWIVLANNDVGEPVYESLVKNQHNAFLTKYTKAYTGTYASLYKLKDRVNGK